MEEKPVVVEDAAGYFRPVRVFFFASLTLFLASAFLSYYLFGESFSSEFLDMFRETYGGLVELHPLLLVAVIFLNNSAKSFGAILLGPAFGVPTILFLILNGFALGLVAYDAGHLVGFPYLLAAILPHGVVELSAVFLSSAVGIRIGLRVINKLRGRAVSVRRDLAWGLKVFAIRVLPLLFIASVIEVFITPSIVSILFKH